MKLNDVDQDLIKYLILGCREASKTNEYFLTSIERLENIQSRLEDGISLKDLKVLRAIYNQVHPIMVGLLTQLVTQSRINQQASTYRKDVDYSHLVKKVKLTSRPNTISDYKESSIAKQPTIYADKVIGTKERELVKTLLEQPTEKFLE